MDHESRLLKNIRDNKPVFLFQACHNNQHIKLSNKYLIEAIKFCRYEIIAEYILINELYADKNDPEILFMAVSRYNKGSYDSRILPLLLQNGFINVGYKTIELITKKDWVELFEILDDNGFVANQTLFYKSIFRNEAELCAQFFINKYGEDVFVKLPKILIYLVESVDEQMKLLLKHLLKSGGDKYINITTDKCRNTALHVAVIELNVYAVKTLCEYGADVSIRSSGGLTPMELLSATQHYSYDKLNYDQCFYILQEYEFSFIKGTSLTE
jgi:hypothetical protein